MFIPIAAGIAFDPREIEETFVRASGPGGQNVNKGGFGECLYETDVDTIRTTGLGRVLISQFLDDLFRGHQVGSVEVSSVEVGSIKVGRVKVGSEPCFQTSCYFFNSRETSTSSLLY